MSTIGHLRQNVDEHLRSIRREIKVAVTPVPRPRAWLFVVGCYNSGTTLLARLLDAHPDISALPVEGQFLTRELVRDDRLGLPRMWHKREDLFRMTESDNGPDVIRMKKEWGMRLDRSCPVLLEKSPPNVARTRWLQANFENPHFVSLLRNGYAVAEGIRRKGRPHHSRTGWTLEEAALQWRRSVEVMNEDAPFLDRFRWLRYEDLTADPVGSLREISEWLAIAPYRPGHLPSSLTVHEREEPVTNLNEVSINRLSTGDIATVNEVAGDCLESCGYRVL